MENIRNLCNQDIFKISKLTGYNNIPLFNDLFKGVGLFNNDDLISVAFLSIFYIYPNDEAPNGFVAEISGVFTKLEDRNKGYAKRCIQYLLSICKHLKIDYVTIDAVKTAEDFYKKIGFIYQSQQECRMYIKL